MCRIYPQLSLGRVLPPRPSNPDPGERPYFMTWRISFHIQNQSSQTNIVKIYLSGKKLLAPPGTLIANLCFALFLVHAVQRQISLRPNYESPNNLPKVAQIRPMQGLRIQDRFEFWMPCCAFRIPGTGVPDSLSTMELEFRFSIVSRNPGSFSCISDSKSQDYWFLITLHEACTIIWTGFSLRAILVWPWNETRKQNRNNKRTEIERFDWLIERIQTRVAFGWLNERWAEKNVMPENCLEINRYFALTS